MRFGCLAHNKNKLAVSIENELVDIFKKGVNMVKHEYEQWRELSQAHWSHWRAWGSWFSWGSPVGLGLFFVFLAIAAAIVVWTVKL